MYEERDNIVPLNRTGIAWKSDKKKFNNPDKMENPKGSLLGSLFFMDFILYGL
jgi:hypothetical protein